MTKSEFLNKIPDFIDHQKYGYSELEILIDNKDKKRVCYRSKDRIASCGTYATTWKELYEDLSNYLILKGYMENKL
jgi:hypothetical protein